jgi:hypothetical protein
MEGYLLYEPEMTAHCRGERKYGRISAVRACSRYSFCNEEPAGFIRYAALASIIPNSPFAKVVFR